MAQDKYFHSKEKEMENTKEGSDQNKMATQQDKHQIL
jgi:hypothetical protein